MNLGHQKIDTEHTPQGWCSGLKATSHQAQGACEGGAPRHSSIRHPDATSGWGQAVSPPTAYSRKSHKLVKFGRKLAKFDRKLANCVRHPEDLCELVKFDCVRHTEDLCELVKFDRKLVNFRSQTCQLCAPASGWQVWISKL